MYICNKYVLFQILLLAALPTSWVETLDVERYNSGDKFYWNSEPLSERLCNAYKADYYDSSRQCVCDPDEFLVTAIHLNTALKCTKLKDYCQVKYLKEGVTTVKVSKKVTKIDKILLWNVKSDLKGEWVELTDHLLDYISITRRGRLLIEATTRKFGGHVMKLMMTKNQCLYLIGSGDISYPYDFNILFPGLIPTTTTTTTTTSTTTTSTTTTTTTTTPTTPITTTTTPTSSTTTTTITDRPSIITTINKPTLSPETNQEKGDKPENSLNIGMIVGITVIVVVVLVLAVIVAIFCRRRRTTNKSPSTEINNPVYVTPNNQQHVGSPITIKLAPADAPNIYASVGSCGNDGGISRAGSTHSLISDSLNTPALNHTRGNPTSAAANENYYSDVPQNYGHSPAALRQLTQAGAVSALAVDNEHYSALPAGSFTDIYAGLSETMGSMVEDQPIYKELYADPNSEYTTPVISPESGGGNYQSLNISGPQYNDDGSNIYHDLKS